MPKYEPIDEFFKIFASNLERAIERWGEVPEDKLLEKQKEQIELLVQKEAEFRKTLIAHPWGPGVYRSFVSFICDEKRNILAARPYFRERQGVFTSHISKALKKRSDRALYKHHFNYQFIAYVMRSRKWPKNGKLAKLAKEIALIRQEIVEMNMPLAISRARIFWSKTPKAQLSFLDLIQISCEGLMAAVDKFCLPFSKVFRAVAIGRILGYFIEEYSETLVHFYPGDKRKIYRANKALAKHNGELDFDRLADFVNRDVDPDKHTDSSEIAGLVSASSCVAIEVPIQDAHGNEVEIHNYVSEEWDRPDVQLETYEAEYRLQEAIKKLSVFERKLLTLKGLGL